MPGVWNIAVYLRLSKDDGDKDESDSISSQRTLISNFILDRIPDGNVVQEFVDDGYTGTNFNRPQFQKMIRSIDEGEINCIIVKDLSRFGRDYIGVGEYLEKFFPLKDVRFIAVNDGYDTICANSNDNFIVPIKNIFNAQYSKDISNKVKSSFRALQGDGKFVGAFACYGYRKDAADRHKLVVDETAAVVVRRIFDLYNHGIGKISIARILNDGNIPCPSEYKRLNGLNYTNGQRMELTKYWTYSTIHNILRNQMYIGNMVQNKSLRKTVRGRAKKNDAENWIIVEHTHEPIIAEDTWNLTQNLLKKNTRHVDFQQNVGLFAGYILCGNCGRAMSKVTDKYKTTAQVTYICGSYKRYGQKVCKRNAVKVDLLEKIVLEKLNEQIKKLDVIRYNGGNGKLNIVPQLKKYESALEKNDRVKRLLYSDYKEGILTQEEYLQYKEEYAKDGEMLKGQIALLKSSMDSEGEERNHWIDTLLKDRNFESLDREIIGEVLDKIIVTGTDEGLVVDVRFRFKML